MKIKYALEALSSLIFQDIHLLMTKGTRVVTSSENSPSSRFKPQNKGMFKAGLLTNLAQRKLDCFDLKHVASCWFFKFGN